MHNEAQVGIFTSISAYYPFFSILNRYQEESLVRGQFTELWTELRGTRRTVEAPRDQQREKLFPGTEGAWEKQYFRGPLRAHSMQEVLPDRSCSQRGT